MTQLKSSHSHFPEGFLHSLSYWGWGKGWGKGWGWDSTNI